MSKERLVELLEEAALAWDKHIYECFKSDNDDEKTYDEFHADYLLSNGVIAPPVNLGDDVWVVEKTNYVLTPFEIHKGFVGHFDIRTYGRFMLIHYESDVGYQIHAFLFECLGKTVFLTREEAEAKLEEGESKCKNGFTD